MARRGRGSTGTGRPSRLPEGRFEAPEPIRHDTGSGLVIDFHGDDGRTGTFSLIGEPMPGWHGLLAEAFAHRTGPGGSVRTLSGALSTFGCIVRWLRWLEASFPEVSAPGELSRDHVNAFAERDDVAETTRYSDMLEMRMLVDPAHIRARLTDDAWSSLRRRMPVPRRDAVGGYSDGEWTRLLAAARADVAAVARRIRKSEELLRQLADSPASLTQAQRGHAGLLAEIAVTGVVPLGDQRMLISERNRLAAELFLVWNDLVPLMVLLAAVTERNGETIKELPAAHRILEGRAVEVVVTKRRRGAKRWFETVTWEIGPKNRELHTAGGLYLLLLELTARSRAICGSASAICLWISGHRRLTYGAAEHSAPFDATLRDNGSASFPRWVARQAKPLLADPEPAPQKPDERVPPKPLEVTFNRIKTTAEVRRTKQTGGHLPSAAKSNTAQVLYANYLRPDATMREWAEEVMGEALVDAEQAARTAYEHAALKIHDQRSQACGGGPDVRSDAGSDEATGTAWAACTDHKHHPATGRDCEESFLACFHCGNCLITRDKLPRLLALLDAMNLRLQQMDEDAWWKRYGPVWAAIRRDVLPKFNPAEVAEIRKHPLPEALLDLVEAPWEHT
ncbi:hypothetical protein [Streptomyces rubiginosohelvolus]|uniref:hypothetical protein n=1 Tax=Streptomyces rubiginosohelvolus TaxID=67362 RepID=UPI00340DE3FD